MNFMTRLMKLPKLFSSSPLFLACGVAVVGLSTTQHYYLCLRYQLTMPAEAAHAHQDISQACEDKLPSDIKQDCEIVAT